MPKSAYRESHRVYARQPPVSVWNDTKAEPVYDYTAGGCPGRQGRGDCRYLRIVRFYAESGGFMFSASFTGWNSISVEDWKEFCSKASSGNEAQINVCPVYSDAIGKLVAKNHCVEFRSIKREQMTLRLPEENCKLAFDFVRQTLEDDKTHRWH